MTRGPIAPASRQRVLAIVLMVSIVALGALGTVAVARAGFWLSARYLMQSYAGVL
jgi:hypothetical protein